jgi:hypothetical protein
MALQESQLSDEIRRQAGANPRVLLRRRNVGLYLAISGSRSAAIDILRRAGIAARPVAVGDVGEADLQGFVADWPCQHCGQPSHPMPVAVEVKSATGKLRDDQVSWRDNVWMRRGGRHIVAAPQAGKTLAQSAAQTILELLQP